MSVDRARKDAAAGAEWLRKLSEIQSRLDKRDEFTAMADAVDVLVSELEAAQKERDELKEVNAAARMANAAARMALLNAQTEATHGKTASVAFIDQCIDSAVRALDAAAAVSGVAAPTEKEER